MAKRGEEALAQRDRELDAWVLRLWQQSEPAGTIIQRLRSLTTTSDMVARRGPNLRRDSEIMLDTLLREWGAARTVKAFAEVAAADRTAVEEGDRVGRPDR